MGRNNKGSNTPGNQQSKRPRASSGEMDENTDALLDTLLGALSDTNTMERFVASLCAFPDVKTKLVNHLLPTLDEQVKLILNPLKATVTDLELKLKESNDRCQQLDNKHDDLEQYTRRQNIRIAGIQEADGENTDNLVITFAKDVLNVDVSAAEIDRSHRVGQKAQNKTTRDIIVRFVSYKSKLKIMKARKAARQHNIHHKTAYYINEDLTKKRSNLASEARKLKRAGVIKDTWTFDGKVFIKSANDVVTVCTELSKLPNPPVIQGNPPPQNNRA